MILKKKVTDVYNRLFLKKQTNFLLDSLTLRVKDKEIQDYYNMMRATEFNKYCYPILVVAIMYLIYGAFTFLRHDDVPPVRLISAGINVVLAIMWVFLKKFSPKHAMIMPYIYLLVHCILTNLSFRDWLPQVMIETNKRADEQKILVLLVFSHSTNYNPFIRSLCVNTTIIVISACLQF